MSAGNARQYTSKELQEAMEQLHQLGKKHKTGSFNTVVLYRDGVPVLIKPHVKGFWLAHRLLLWTPTFYEAAYKVSAFFFGLKWRYELKTVLVLPLPEGDEESKKTVFSVIRKY